MPKKSRLIQPLSSGYIGNSTHGSAPSFAAIATVGEKRVVSKKHRIIGRSKVHRAGFDLATRAENKQLVKAILSAAKAVKNCCFDKLIDVPGVISYILHSERGNCGGGTRYLLLMAGLLRDDCIDKGTVQLVWLLCRCN